MKRATQHTSSAAVLATGAELSRRGYDVTFTLGNTARIDLLCTVPDGELFKVQVKGISTENAFYIDKSFFEGEIQPNLFLVVVLVLPIEVKPSIEVKSSFQFFVLSHAESKSEFEKMRTTKRDGRPYESGWGLTWGSVKGYKDAWKKFPALP
jgi:hypothetical protein